MVEFNSAFYDSTTRIEYHIPDYQDYYDNIEINLKKFLKSNPESTDLNYLSEEYNIYIDVVNRHESRDFFIEAGMHNIIPTLLQAENAIKISDYLYQLILKRSDNSAELRSFKELTSSKFWINLTEEGKLHIINDNRHSILQNDTQEWLKVENEINEKINRDIIDHKIKGKSVTEKIELLNIELFKHSINKTVDWQAKLCDYITQQIAFWNKSIETKTIENNDDIDESILTGLLKKDIICLSFFKKINELKTGKIEKLTVETAVVNIYIVLYYLVSNNHLNIPNFDKIKSQKKQNEAIYKYMAGHFIFEDIQELDELKIRKKIGDKMLKSKIPKKIGEDKRSKYEKISNEVACYFS
jgi:hypothetical protein